MKVATVLLLCSLLTSLQAQDKASVPFYGNEKCPDCAKDVDKSLYATVETQRIYVATKECKAKVKADAAAMLKKAYPDDKVVDLKLKACPFMGKPVQESKTIVWQGHKIGFCCGNCVKKFQKEPGRSLTLMKNKELKIAGNKMCPVMPKEEIVPDTYILYKGTLIDLCCDSCPEEFIADPDKFMKVLQGSTPGGEKKVEEKKGDEKNSD